MAVTVTAEQAIQALGALAKLASSLSAPSDTATILDAIENLSQQMKEGFKYLSELIEEQTQIIVNAVNRAASSAALSNSDTALLDLENFSGTKKEQYLVSAEDHSSDGVGFFLELAQASDQSGKAPFFLPGLAKAGTIWISVITLDDSNFLTSRPLAVSTIRQMIGYLGDMIGIVKQTVEAAHTVLLRKEPRQDVPSSVPSTYYVAVEYVKDAQGKITRNEVGDQHFFKGGSEGAARALAERDRSAAVAHGLTSLGIPEFEVILQSWKAAVRMA